MEPLMTPLELDPDDPRTLQAAAETVRQYAVDDADCATLLDMLGLE